MPLNPRPRFARLTSGRNSPRFRPIRIERLEERTVLAYNLTHTLLPDPTGPQESARFGTTVATDTNYHVVGSPLERVGGFAVGAVRVYDAATGALVRTLANPAPSDLDQFGYSVAVSGNLVVVGAVLDDAGGTDNGQAYVFNATNGALVATLVNPTPAANDHFGQSVAISGNTVLVGAPGDDTSFTDNGQAYLFDANTGVKFADVANPLPSGGDQFGYAVAISGNTAVVSSWEEDTGAINSGQAYTFDAVTGANLRTLANPSPALNDHFGHFVAVSGNTVVVGAPLDDTGATDSGQAYIFNATSGALTATLANPSPAANDNFGLNVAASSSKVVVAAHADDTQNSNSGLVYTYTTAGVFVATINNPSPDGGDAFGTSIAAYGDTLIVGANQDDTEGDDVGRVYVLNAVSGAVVQTLVNPSPAMSDFFGASLAISGNRILVGVPLEESGGSNGGAAFLYDKDSGALVASIPNPSAFKTGDQFGGNVAMADGVIAVGVPSEFSTTAYAGAAYLFDGANGALLRTLPNPAPAFNDGFGSAVAISGNLVAIGSHLDDNGGTDVGCAYVFNIATGALVATLLNPSPDANDRFGASIALSGNLVVVGALQDDTGASDSGRAYVFNATTGALVATLANPSPAANDYFGASVSLAGGVAAVGAYKDDTVSTDRGQVYLFDAATGALSLTLNNPSGTGASNFGQSVAVSGDLVMIGAHNDSTEASLSGRAFLFNTAGMLIAAFNNPTPAFSDLFGYSVAISGATVVVGALRDDVQNFDQGTVYVYSPGTSVSLAAGNVSIHDSAAENDRVTVSRVNVSGTDYLRVSDTLNPLRAAAGTIQYDARTVDIPFASVTGTLNFNGGLGDDTFTLNFSGGDPIPDGEITFNGGGGSDSLALTNGATTAITHTFTNANDGAVALSGAYAGSVFYTGLEPIADNLAAVDRIFTFNGGAETITVTTGAALHNRIDSTQGESVEFNNPTGSLTINAGTGADTVTLTSVHGGFQASLTINGDAGDDFVNLNADITFAAGANLDVNLQNDDATPGADAISVGANANLMLSGAGTAVLKAAKGIALLSGSSVVTVDGSLTVEGNRQATPASGGFVGVQINGGLLQTTGGGTVAVKGTGGDGSGGLQYGINLQSGGAIVGGTAGATIEGVGGGSTGNGNIGIRVTGTNSRINSIGGPLSVEGRGGGLAASSDNLGVRVFSAGTITNTGTAADAALTVRGFGGNTAGNSSANFGVDVAFPGARISSAGGAVTVEGTAGGGGTGGSNFGVNLGVGGVINTTSPTANVTVRGFGGGGTGAGSNFGVYVDAAGSLIAAAGGATLVEGTGGGGGASTANYGVYVRNGGAISNTGAGSAASVTVRGNGGNIAATGGSLNAGVVVEEMNSLITASGGPVLVEGVGGGASTAHNNQGVRIIFGGQITNAGPADSATVTVRGWGGNPGSAGSSGGSNIGVFINGTNSKVTSGGGAVEVMGRGGGATNSGANAGVSLQAEGMITSAGTTASVTVNGAGGRAIQPGGGIGVFVTGAQITSGGGPVSVTGVGGGTGSSFTDHGVELYLGGVITSGPGPLGSVSVVGTGGGNSNGTNRGVQVGGAASFISSGGGDIWIEGSTPGMFTTPITVYNDGRIIAGTGVSNVTLVADGMELTATASVAAPDSHVTLRPRTAGAAIDLGGGEMFNPAGLGLTVTELDHVTAAAMTIGGAAAGDVSVSADITRPTTAPFNVTSGGAIQLNSFRLNTSGPVRLEAGTNVQVRVSGVDVNTGSGLLTFGGGETLDLRINSVIPGLYDNLTVAGGVDLTGVTLRLSGSQAPHVGYTYTLVDNDGTDDILGRFVGLPDGARIFNFLSSGLDATINYRGGTGNDVVLTVVAALTSQHVIASAATASGATFALSHPAAIDGLNLYDYRDTGGASVLGPADVRLTNSAGQSIPGSLVIAAGDAAFTFVATSGVLPPDTYTLTVRSASNGFRRPNGELLDGDADGVAGGDFVRTFVVSAPPADTVVVSLPHFSRGPDQPVNTPADLALGLPLRINAGSQVGSLTFELRFDPGLLNVTGVNLPASAPAGSTSSHTVLGAGHVRVTLTFASPLAAGAQAVAYLQAAVPVSAAGRYGEREALDISAIDLRTGGGVAIPALDQDGVHANAYFGDLGRNGRYDSFDVQQASRMAVRLDTGFQQHPLLDPTILADFNYNGRIDSFDVQQLSRLALRLPVNGVAALPSPAPTTTDTDRLTGEESPKSEPAKPDSAPRSDVDGNGAVDAQDVAWAIYYFNLSENGAAPSEAQNKKLDLNGDMLFDAADILLAVTDLNTQSAAAEGEGTSAATTDGESDADLNSLTFLLAEDLVASRKKK